MTKTKRVARYDEPRLDVVTVKVECGFSLSSVSLESISGVAEETEW